MNILFITVCLFIICVELCITYAIYYQSKRYMLIWFILFQYDHWILDLRSNRSEWHVCPSSMSCQMATLAERFVTHIAPERFFTSVCASMCWQLTNLAERFVTHIAPERFFTSVCASMYWQLTNLAERFVTDIAWVIFCLHFFVRVTAGCFYL